ncbi:MAG: NADH-quinone oxidoreductase subunit NuoE [Myxococcales bacterium]
MIARGTEAAAPSPFTPEQQRRFDEGFEWAVNKYPPERRKSALLAVLHVAQDQLGWLSEAAMAYVGARLEVPAVRVREVATFYTMYRLKPVGRHHIGVCNSISCWAMGSEKILHHCEERLGIKKGETTKDGQFSLEEVACLAACGNAPAVLVNNFAYYENVTPDSMSRLILELTNMPGQHMAPGPEPRATLPILEKQSAPQATGPGATTTSAEAGTTERR